MTTMKELRTKCINLARLMHNSILFSIRVVLVFQGGNSFIPAVQTTQQLQRLRAVMCSRISLITWELVSLMRADLSGAKLFVPNPRPCFSGHCFSCVPKDMPAITQALLLCVRDRRGIAFTCFGGSKTLKWFRGLCHAEVRD